MKATRRRVIIEPSGDGGLLVMVPSGQVYHAYTPAQALTIATRGLRPNHSAIITTIEWRNMPEGFAPPAGGAR